MAQKISLSDYRKSRAQELMDAFLYHSYNARKLAEDGNNFITVHEEQIHAANYVNDLYHEGLLDVAEELYPQEAESMKEYLEIYEEISKGEEV